MGTALCRRSGKTQTLAVMEAMTHAIKADFRYGARFEEGTQTAAETIAVGSGTCRDFAVLMMEALRCFGVATRFVTGYLYDDTSGTTRGGGSTHAWCNDICREPDGWNTLQRMVLSPVLSRPCWSNQIRGASDARVRGFIGMPR